MEVFCRLVTLFLLFTLSALAEPWSISEENPIIQDRDPSPVGLGMTDYKFDFEMTNYRFDHGYFFYQKVLSPADGARCKMYPTCTDYGYQAIKKHGLFLGGWMATDRLMRDNGFSDHYYPLIEKFGRPRLFDPIIANDFWFRK